MIETLTGQRDYLELGGLRLAYRAAGLDGPPGRPVVLLHGWGASLEALTGVQKVLSDGFRVLSFDLPGFGESDPPPTAWDSNDYASVILEGLDRLGIEQTHLVGHSFGGKVALRITSSRPDRVGRLVLVNSAGLRPRRTIAFRARAAGYRILRQVARSGRLRAWLAGRMGSEDYRSAGRLRPTLVRCVNEDLRAILPGITVPTLLIWGDLDDATPLADGQLMEALIPDAGLVVFGGAGHFAYADDLPRFCRVVSHFLQS